MLTRRLRNISLLSKQTIKMSTNINSNALARLSLTQKHINPTRSTWTHGRTITHPNISNVNQGTKYTSDFKNYAIDQSTGKVLSYFHDIPLELDVEAKEANMIVEIPRWSNAKFEISTKLPANPIIQDSKNGKVRFVKNLFPHHGYIHNYGAFPQTWEDPTTEHSGLFGDNDPLDVCEIGSLILKTGDIKRVKILGSIALIDDGELDWKVIVVNVDDPLANEVYDVHHLITKCPGLLETTRQWFKDYKLPDGKPENTFAYNAVFKNARDTIETIQQCNNSWKQLVLGQIKSDKKLPTTTNVTLKGTPGYVKDIGVSLDNPSKPDAEIPIAIQKNYFMVIE
ncbi:PPA2 [[Candida] subhashii]|uniref:inorganic diphosphatase n=1 Tax=[Candida] subhashii TaxID=561895 RepID=A0A8J5UWU5_9ASCO|nr:PPA2 [[Candida] subhashii]KAG7661894.1 PPA2 [[Candida] subhashii]